MPIDKATIPLVALEEMNQTHLSEVDLINRLSSVISQNRDGEDVNQLLASLVDELEKHVTEHFANEERLMLEYEFPAYMVHKSEHDRVLGELDEITQLWRSEADIEPLANYLENVHPSWAHNHIATMDLMTAYFITQCMATKGKSL